MHVVVKPRLVCVIIVTITVLFRESFSFHEIDTKCYLSAKYQTYALQIEFNIKKHTPYATIAILFYN